MHIKTLKYFLTIADTQNLTLAAARLNITQSALSHFINHLESDLGCTLFTRTRHTVILNDNGKLLLKSAVKSTEILDSAFLEMRESAGIPSNTLVLEIYAGSKHLSKIIEQMFLKHAEIQIFATTELSPIHRLVYYGATDLIFYSTIDDSIDDGIILYKEPLVIVCDKNHVLATASSLSLASLKNQQFLLFDCTNDLHKLCKHYCTRMGFEPNILSYSSKIEIMNELIKENRAIALLPKSYEHPDLINIPINDCECYRYIRVKQANNKFHSKIATTLIDACKDYFRNLQNNMQPSAEILE